MLSAVRASPRPRPPTLGAARRYDAPAQFLVKAITFTTSQTIASVRAWLSSTLVVHSVTSSPSRTAPGAFDYAVKVQIRDGRTATDGEIRQDVVDALNRPAGNVLSSSISPLYGATPIPDHELGDEGSSGAGPTVAELAASVVGDLRARGAGYNPDLMRRFQRAAGIAADGIYGEQTRAALGRYVAGAPTVESVRSTSGRVAPPAPLPSGSGMVSAPPREGPGAGPWVVAAVMLLVLGGAAWAVTKT